MLKKIKNFIAHLAKHIKNGMPKSSQQIINARYDICLSCDSFDFDNSECKICGCNINTKKQTMNKLAWKDSECPLNKW